MRERENAELVEDNRDVVGRPWIAYGPTDICNGSGRVIVLHVEDHDIVALMTKEMLESEGREVETCSDGNVALEKIFADKPLMTCCCWIMTCPARMG